MRSKEARTASSACTRVFSATWWRQKGGGGGGGVGGLAVMALVGLVAFVCGVAVLTVAALTLFELRHTNLNYVAAQCSVLQHTPTTRTRCSHRCRTEVRPQLTVAYTPRPEDSHGSPEVELIQTTARWRAGRQWQEEGAAQGFFRRNPINSTRECYYNPDNLADVVMEKEFLNAFSFWAWLGGTLLVSALCILVAAYLFYLVILWTPLTKLGFLARHPQALAPPPPGGAINAGAHDYGTFVGGGAGYESADYAAFVGGTSDSDEDVEIELQPRRKQFERAQQQQQMNTHRQ